MIADVGLVASRMWENPRCFPAFPTQGQRSPIIIYYPKPAPGRCEPGRRQQLCDGGYSRLIEGASDGAGLGHEFLRHIERTKVLLHVVDAASVEGRDPVEDIHTIMNELSTYNPELLKLPQVIAANKLDALYDEEHDP